ncbi:MAG: glycosyltransferase family 4 protein [Marinilabiliales bacterium]|nr:MAG: glycosyltransferase family 4 protein [Marinilabiliales bacterium]
MRVAILSPVAWRTPPRHYGPWEQVAWNIASGVAALGVDVTLYATGDSGNPGKLEYIIDKGYEEDRSIDAKVAECMHISHLMERAGEYDLIHNNFDFLPLAWSRLVATPMVTTIHGFSSPRIIPVYRRYNDRVHYVSISNSDRSSELEYIATVYNGIDPSQFTFREEHGNYLLFFGRIHHDKGAYEAIQIARLAGMKLLIAGIVQDEDYYREKVEPFIDGKQVVYLGSADPQKRDELLGGALALLHPINFEEPFGLSVAESMFCGTPVIAFNRGSMPELISHGETGFLAGSVEEAAGLVGRTGELSRQICRERAMANFSLERMAAGYLEVYRKILG